MLRSGSDRPSTTIQEMLHSVGMRATVQRIALARLLLRSKNRRVTTEILYDEALEARCPVSRARRVQHVAPVRAGGLAETDHRSRVEEGLVWRSVGGSVATKARRGP